MLFLQTILPKFANYLTKYIDSSWPGSNSKLGFAKKASARAFRERVLIHYYGVKRDTFAELANDAQKSNQITDNNVLKIILNEINLELMSLEKIRESYDSQPPGDYELFLEIFKKAIKSAQKHSSVAGLSSLDEHAFATDPVSIACRYLAEYLCEIDLAKEAYSTLSIISRQYYGIGHWSLTPKLSQSLKNIATTNIFILQNLNISDRSICLQTVNIIIRGALEQDRAARKKYWTSYSTGRLTNKLKLILSTLERLADYMLLQNDLKLRIKHQYLEANVVVNKAVSELNKFNYTYSSQYSPKHAMPSITLDNIPDNTSVHIKNIQTNMIKNNEDQVLSLVNHTMSPLNNSSNNNGTQSPVLFVEDILLSPQAKNSPHV